MIELDCSRAGSMDTSGKFHRGPSFQLTDTGLFRMTQEKWGACLSVASDARLDMSISSPSAPPSRDSSTVSTPTLESFVPDDPLQVHVDSDGEQLSLAWIGLRTDGTPEGSIADFGVKEE